MVTLCDAVHEKAPHGLSNWMHGSSWRWCLWGFYAAALLEDLHHDNRIGEQKSMLLSVPSHGPRSSFLFLLPCLLPAAIPAACCYTRCYAVSTIVDSNPLEPQVKIKSSFSKSPWSWRFLSNRCSLVYHSKCGGSGGRTWRGGVVHEPHSKRWGLGAGDHGSCIEAKADFLDSARNPVSVK